LLEESSDLLPEDKPDKEIVGKDDKQKESEPKPIGFRQMFRFADTTDLTLMWFGGIAALAAGTIMPLFSFIFGDVATIFIKPDPIGESLKIAIKFWVLAAASWVLSKTSSYLRLRGTILLDYVGLTSVPKISKDLLQAIAEARGVLV